ncbi:DUF1648 domain-containing protein [Lysinibacillus yapensis]|uniref:DUF1648 domain-containing protein n=1 Tax=Ureibacillus yapensis TaxID=2304605 RepID=A0A396SAP4_9BACL|nr:DUF1648 domain-containing protein [Lysinibacillus yapensis]RHW38421.1 DUF1648 domain-containing protein [Lysinibacillus yapensis]
MQKLPYRPILKLPKTKFEKIMDILGLAIFTGAILYLIVHWTDIPDRIPAHFNWDGEVDRWGSKVELIILPCIGLFLFIFLSLLEKAPHMHNYPHRLNEANVKQFYLNSRKMLNAIKNICLAMFAFILIKMVRVSLGKIDSLGIWILPIVIIAVTATMVIGIYKQSKIV